MSVVDEGAHVVREYRGVNANVLVYKRRCDACGNLAPRNSVAVLMFPYDDAPYDTEGFSCPRYANHQAVRVRVESGNGEDFLPSIGDDPVC